MSIALLCPTRGRPEQCQRMIESCYKTSSQKIQVFIAVSKEEFETYKNTLKLPNSDRVGICMVTMPDCPTVHKWNRLAQLAMQESNNEIFVLAADDMIFDTRGWDKALIDHYNALENKIHVYHLQDSRDKDGTPHPIVTREYIEAMGYFLSPIFLHWFCDSWTVQIAKANNCFTHLREYSLIHDKPSDEGKPDKTHSRIRQMGWHDRDVWVNDRCQHMLENEGAKLALAMMGHKFLGLKVS